MRTSTLAWVAGEKSGDLIAGPVLKHLHELAPTCAHVGIGGDSMIAAGLDAWNNIDELSVRGYAEVLSALPRLLRLRRQLVRRLLTLRPTVFVGVDAPDFNLNLERKLRAANIRTVHFVSPSVWAWRASRLKKIGQSVDHMLLVFPFEKPIYDQAGISATYVGHPLADAIDPQAWSISAAREQLQVLPPGPLICLMPGSRNSEVKYMGETFMRCAQWLFARNPQVSFVLPAANSGLKHQLETIWARVDPQRLLPLKITDGNAYTAIAAADTVLVASGTATLEVALFQKPMVVAYQMAASSYQIMRRMALQPWISLPNILCRASIVPELIQNDASPEKLGQALLDQLDHPARAAAIVARLTELRAELAIGCAARAGQLIAEIAEQR